MNLVKLSDGYVNLDLVRRFRSTTSPAGPGKGCVPSLVLDYGDDCDTITHPGDIATLLEALAMNTPLED